MITHFADSETQIIFSGAVSRKLPPEIQQIVLRKLQQLNAAETILEMAVPPGNRLEKLKGDRSGQYSIRINDQWRICFRFEPAKENRPAEATEVEVSDYH